MNVLTKNGTNVFKRIIQKKEFVALVFLHLLFQLSVTYMTAKYTTHQYNHWLLLIAAIIVVVVMLSAPMHPAFKFALFVLFSYILGLSSSSVKDKHSEQEIMTAMENTVLVMIAMVIVAVALLVFGVQLGDKFGFALFFMLIGLIIARIFIISAGNTISNSLMHSAGVMLFSLYIMYDTNTMLQRGYQGDVITASLNYYLDVVNLFQDVLN
jgi:FtsH-binding integral membrane protein